MSVCCEYCVCCQVEVSATGWSLVQSSRTDCGASLSVIRNLVIEGVLAHWGAVAPPPQKSKISWTLTCPHNTACGGGEVQLQSFLTSRPGRFTLGNEAGWARQPVGTFRGKRTLSCICSFGYFPGVKL